MFNKLLNLFGSSSYEKEQSNRVSYEVELTNMTKFKQAGSLIIPAVSTRETQTVLDDVVFAPAAELQVEQEFGNRYIVWNFELEPNEEQSFKQFFKIKTLPTPRMNEKVFSLDDYLKLDESLKRKYLAANDYLQPENPEIIDIAKKLRGNDKNLLKILRKINDYVIETLKYGNPIPGLYKAQYALDQKIVDCGGFDTLFVSLCQAIGIPARVVSGFWAGYHKNDMHAWAEVLLPNGLWLPADPATEYLARKNRTRKSGKLGFAGSDRITFSVGCDLTLSVPDAPADIEASFSTDILQNPIIYPINENIRVRRIVATQPL